MVSEDHKEPAEPAIVTPRRKKQLPSSPAPLGAHGEALPCDTKCNQEELETTTPSTCANRGPVNSDFSDASTCAASTFAGSSPASALSTPAGPLCASEPSDSSQWPWRKFSLTSAYEEEEQEHQAVTQDALAPTKSEANVDVEAAGKDGGLYFGSCEEVNFSSWIHGEFRTVGKLGKSAHCEVFYLETKDKEGNNTDQSQGAASAVAKVVPTETVERCRRKTTSDEEQIWFSKADVRSVEDPWSEIAVLTSLLQSEQCRYLIRLQGLFQDAASTYLVMEYCDGGELFERVAYGEPLDNREKRDYVWQLLKAVQHLHGRNIGHRDVSLENVLLRRGECVLMDFGQAVPLRHREPDGSVIRYYAAAGKRMYRAPEMYVPRERPLRVVCPTDELPGTRAQVSYDNSRCEVELPANAVPGRACVARPAGYAVAPADIFACGVCAFVLSVGKPPWVMARDTDPAFSFIRRSGVSALLQQWRDGCDVNQEAPGAEEPLLAATLRIDPRKRPDVEECLQNPWFIIGDDTSAENGAPSRGQ